MVTEAVKGFKVGDGLPASTTYGPLIHDRAVAKLAAHVEDAVSKGARARSSRREGAAASRTELLRRYSPRRHNTGHAAVQGRDTL